jgi:hypothetical protein
VVRDHVGEPKRRSSTSGRASVSYTDGCRFKAGERLQWMGVPQLYGRTHSSLVEQRAENVLVPGSNPGVLPQGRIPPMRLARTHPLLLQIVDCRLQTTHHAICNRQSTIRE